MVNIYTKTIKLKNSRLFADFINFKSETIPSSRIKKRIITIKAEGHQ